MFVYVKKQIGNATFAQVTRPVEELAYELAAHVERTNPKLDDYLRLRWYSLMHRFHSAGNELYEGDLRGLMPKLAQVSGFSLPLVAEVTRDQIPAEHAAWIGTGSAQRQKNRAVACAAVVDRLKLPLDFFGEAFVQKCSNFNSDYQLTKPARKSKPAATSPQSPASGEQLAAINERLDNQSRVIDAYAQAARDLCGEVEQLRNEVRRLTTVNEKAASLLMAMLNGLKPKPSTDDTAQRMHA